MRKVERIKPFMEEITKLWEENCPDWRFGQLIINVFGDWDRDPFFPEEDEILERFKSFFNKNDNSK